MPFVKQECRAEGHQACAVGDLCYVQYKKLVDEFKKNPRWTTVHDLFRETFEVDDAQAAKTLSWFVFVAKYVMPYEDEKEKENGSI